MSNTYLSQKLSDANDKKLNKRIGSLANPKTYAGKAFKDSVEQSNVFSKASTYGETNQSLIDLYRQNAALEAKAIYAKDFKEAVEKGKKNTTINEKDGYEHLPPNYDKVVNAATKGVHDELRKAKYLSDTQSYVIDYYQGIEDYDSLNKYIDGIERGLNEKAYYAESIKEIEDAYKYGQDNNVGAFITQTVKPTINNIDYYVDTAIRNIDNWIHGTDYPADPYSGLHAEMQKNQAMTEGLMEGKSSFGQFLMQAGLSTAQNAVLMPIAAIPVVGKPLYLGIMASSSAGAKSYETIENGGTLEDALFMGTMSGTIEAATEMLPLDLLGKNIKAMFKGTAKATTKEGVKSILKQIAVNTAKQAGSEFAEETVAEIANLAVDWIYYGTEGEIPQHYRSLLAQGKTEGEALWETIGKYGEQAVMSGLMGAVSGAMMGGLTSSGAAIAGNISAKNQNKLNSQLEQANDINSPAESNVPLDIQISQDSNVISGDTSAPSMSAQEIKQTTAEASNSAMELAKRGNVQESMEIRAALQAVENYTAQYERLAADADIGESVEYFRQNDIGETMQTLIDGIRVMGDSGDLNGMNALNSTVQSLKNVYSDFKNRVIQVEAENTRILNADYSSYPAGIVSNEISERVRSAQPEQFKKINDLTQALGLKTVFVNNVTAGNGYANGKLAGDVIYLSSALDTDVSFYDIAKHEITHYLKKAAPKEYKKFEKYVGRALGNDALEADIRRLQRQAQELGIELSRDAAIEEVSAEYAQKLLTDEKTVTELLDKNPSLFKKVWSAVKDLIARIKASLSGSYDEELKNIERLWARAYRKAYSTGIDIKPLQKYSVKDRHIIAGYVDAVDPKLKSYIEDVLKGRKAKQYYELQNLNQRAINDLYNVAGIDTTGYKSVIEDRQIMHIDREHGSNGLADNSMADINDIARLQYVLENYDSVYDGGITNAYKTPKGEGKSKNAKTVVYVKKINGTYYLVQALPESKAKSLYIVSAYINKKGLTQVSDAVRKPARFTSETALASRPSNTNISQTENGVNVEGPQFGDAVSSQTVTSETGSAFPSSDITISQNESNVNTQLMQPEEKISAKKNKSALITEEQYNKLREEYGEYDLAPNAVRDTKAPLQTADDNYVRQTARTLMGAEMTSDLAAEEIMRNINSFTTTRSSNAESLRKAAADIEENGYMGAVDMFKDVVKANKADMDTVTLGATLYGEAVKNNDIPLAMDIAQDLAIALSDAGKTLQAANVIRKLTPEGRLYAAQKSLNRLIAKYEQEFKDKNLKITVDTKLYENLKNAKTQKEIGIAQAALYQHIADQIPTRFREKIRNWRYMAMLTNPLTHLRNIYSNLTMPLLIETNNAIGAVMERAFIKNGERTKAVLTKNDKALIDFAKRDYTDVSSELQGNKYSESNEIESRRKMFNNKLLETIRTKNTNAMSAEDGWFKRSTYVKAEARYLKANNVTADMLQSDNADIRQMLDKARVYAIKEALESTFQDESKLAKKLTQLAKSNRVAGFILDSIMPFTKTPINMTKRAFEYSPLGIIKGVNDMITKVKKGDMTSAQALNNITKGMTGTMVMMLGYFLKSVGIIVPSPDDDEGQGVFDRLSGRSGYSLKIGDTYYSLNWLAPFSIPLFMGAEIEGLVSGDSALTDGDATAEDYFQEILRISDPILEMSFLQGMQSFLESLSYDASLDKAVLNSTLSYFGQFVPTVSGQIARTTDPYRRTTYTEGAEFPEIVRWAQKQMAKVPGLSYLMPKYVDQFGNYDMNFTDVGSFIGNAAENFVSPGYVSTDTNDPVVKALEELYKEAKGDPTVTKALQNSIVPDYIDKKIKVGDEEKTLTAEEYEKYAVAYGKNAYQYIGEFTTADTDRLRTADKADIISTLFQYADERAKESVTDYLIEKNGSSEIKQLKAAEEAGIKPYEYLLSQSERYNLLQSIKDEDLAEKVLEAYESRETTEAERFSRTELYEIEDRTTEIAEGYTKELFNSSYYNNLPESERYSAIQSTYAYAKAKAKYEVANAEMSTAHQKIFGAESLGLDALSFMRLKKEAGAVRADRDANGNPISGTAKAKKIQLISQYFPELTAEQQQYIFDALDISTSNNIAGNNNTNNSGFTNNAFGSGFGNNKSGFKGAFQ